MIELLDISNYQTVPDWNKLISAGIRGIIIRSSFGSSYQDPKFVSHYAGAKSVGLMIGAYHFVTLDNPIAQYDCFMKVVGNRNFDLRPMLDCERYGSMIPTESIIDVIGRKLSGFQGFDYPSIYTNYSSGNLIFKSKSMARYPLHVANWGVSKPLLPDVWKDEIWYIWQDAVISGEKYGITGNVDHNVWGEKYPFPGQPPIPVETMQATMWIDKQKFTGTLNQSNT